jgi:hypothetical protein
MAVDAICANARMNRKLCITFFSCASISLFAQVGRMPENYLAAVGGNDPSPGS